MKIVSSFVMYRLSQF